MPVPKPVVCSEKVALLNAYQETTKAYSQAVTELRRITGICSQADYDAQFRMTEVLRMDASKALRDLDDHVADHGC